MSTCWAPPAGRWRSTRPGATGPGGRWAASSPASSRSSAIEVSCSDRPADGRRAARHGPTPGRRRERLPPRSPSTRAGRAGSPPPPRARRRQPHPPVRRGDRPRSASRAFGSLGLQMIELDTVVGTVDSRRDFDRRFRPTSTRVRERWERLALAQRRGEAVPPIDVYRVGDLHFVRDGHHRVSIALGDRPDLDRGAGHRGVDDPAGRGDPPTRRSAAPELRAALPRPGPAARGCPGPDHGERSLVVRDAGRGGRGLGLPLHADGEALLRSGRDRARAGTPRSTRPSCRCCARPT